MKQISTTNTWEVSQQKKIDASSLEKYRSRKAKADDIQELHTSLFYDLIRLNRVTKTSTFADLISKYDLVIHSISYLSLQITNTPK